MTQEDKDLLFHDLSARLPYRVIVKYKSREKEGNIKITCGNIGYITELGNGWWKECKPYLRPMSSMTEEEKKDILQSLNIHGDIDNEGNLLLGVGCDIITLKVCKKYLGELNKRMFDVCHMIEKGLALEAPEGMYNKH